MQYKCEPESSILAKVCYKTQRYMLKWTKGFFEQPRREDQVTCKEKRINLALDFPAEKFYTKRHWSSNYKMFKGKSGMDDFYLIKLLSFTKEDYNYSCMFSNWKDFKDYCFEALRGPYKGTDSGKKRWQRKWKWKIGNECWVNFTVKLRGNKRKLLWQNIIYMSYSLKLHRSYN